MRPKCKIPAQLLNLAKSYGLPKLTTYTVVKLQFLGLQLSRQILFFSDGAREGSDPPDLPPNGMYGDHVLLHTPWTSKAKDCALR
jgi:hypothetical protein